MDNNLPFRYTNKDAQEILKMTERRVIYFFQDLALLRPDIEAPIGTAFKRVFSESVMCKLFLLNELSKQGIRPLMIKKICEQSDLFNQKNIMTCYFYSNESIAISKLSHSDKIDIFRQNEIEKVFKSKVTNSKYLKFDFKVNLIKIKKEIFSKLNLPNQSIREFEFERMFPKFNK